MTFEEYCDSKGMESHGYDFRQAEIGWSAAMSVSAAEIAALQAEADRLKVERATLRHLVCDLVDTMDLPHAIFSPPAIEAAQKIRAEEYGDTPEKQ